MIDDARMALLVAKRIQDDIRKLARPTVDSRKYRSDELIDVTIVARTKRQYIERVASQINGAFENEWYDACAVMLRRLVETLIIEVFEARGIADKIKNANGDFKQLEDLIAAVINEPSWSLARDAKKILPEIKALGDRSAHNRRFNATQSNITRLRLDIHALVQELVSLAELT